MIRLIIFDLDETIIHNSIPFSEIRKTIMEKIGSSEKPVHLYEFLKAKGKNYLELLKKEELRRAKNSYPDRDLGFVIDVLVRRNINIAVLTRNSRKATMIALGKYAEKFDAIITREDFFPPKPAPDAVFYLMEQFSARAEETVVVGDYDYDIEAGRRAGCVTVRIGDGEGDYNINKISEIITLPILPKP